MGRCRWSSLGLGVTTVACAAALACGGRSLRRTAETNDGGSNAFGGTAGTSSGGSGNSRTGGASAVGGNPSGTGGAVVGGNGATAVGGSASGGNAGTPETGGEGGSPTEPECEPPLVRCGATGFREHCDDNGFWVAESFACTTGISGSLAFARLCAVKAASGEIACFSTGPNMGQEELVAAFPDEHWIDVAVSDDRSSTCALSREGFLFCIEDASSALRRNDGPFASIAISTSGTCGLLRDGTIGCPEGSLRVPTGRFTTFSLAFDQIFALRPDGSLYQSYVRLPPDERYTDAQANPNNPCGVLANGSLICHLEFDQFAEVSNETFVEVVREPYNRVCARRTDGTLACWNGIALDDPRPPPSGTFTALAATWNGFCALRTDGTTTCWSRVPADAVEPTEGW